MADALRWGILGAANFAAEHMAPAIHAARGNRLAALASSSDAKAERFRAINDQITVFDDYDALLASDAIDAVYIPLPNHLHVDWTLKAVAAGKHVLCEKPIALEAGEIDALIAARDESGLVVAEAFMIVHHPQWQRAKALLAEGAVGTLGHADVAFSFHNANMDNIRNKPETGGGGIRDIGVYAYGSVRYATGAEPLTLAARVRTENGVDTWAQADGVMEGPLGRFTYCAMTSTRLAPRQHVTFHGDGATLTLTSPFNAGLFGEAQIVLRAADGTVTRERFPAVNHYVLQVENFAASVRDGAAYPMPLEMSRGTQAMMDMVFASASDISW
ncbi:Gfo/Idh/MocA family oxidoreductase [Maritimibacter sp. UBA3975]|uniref:Gfo/Idh/MocA family protein n=1 Tax=Maritimibacter sp. UBA3975 TaxID=1946833 RepID=UPI000C097642|nr:Gfo/Idh/MocA family oxidoreductase [Maritimibacter sp. UBA3975]MAM61030.1 oxidoreductase [Maritimibacter sp.]|tara:strand:+ start:5070 stop:6059 length:990 start_codon:yes stop_codon:yes gene_type:complete